MGTPQIRAGYSDAWRHCISSSLSQNKCACDVINKAGRLATAVSQSKQSWSVPDSLRVWRQRPWESSAPLLLQTIDLSVSHTYRLAQLSSDLKGNDVTIWPETGSDVSQLSPTLIDWRNSAPTSRVMTSPSGQKLGQTFTSTFSGVSYSHESDLCLTRQRCGSFEVVTMSQISQSKPGASQNKVWRHKPCKGALRPLD